MRLSWILDVGMTVSGLSTAPGVVPGVVPGVEEVPRRLTGEEMQR